MGLIVVLQKLMHGSPITHWQSLVRHQQQPGKVSGIKSPTHQEPDRGRNAILPETKQWSELASDASLTVIKFTSLVLRMVCLARKKRQESKRKDV